MPLFDNNLWKPKAQARAVLTYLEQQDGVAASYCDKQHRYEMCVSIAEWYNGREVGYVLSGWSKRYYNGEQLNIAWFEHRNSDDICAIKWKQHTVLNPPNIKTACFEDIYKTKWDVSHTVPYGQACEMASWIMEQLEAHWIQKREG